MNDHAFPYPMLTSSIGLASSAIVARLAVSLGWGEISARNAQAVAGPEYVRLFNPFLVPHRHNLQKTGLG
jgi:hypothetical protein